MDTHSNPSAVGGFKKTSGIALAALLVFGAVAGVIAYSPQSAIAQTTPTIATSTNTFFGNNIVQVIVTDSTKNSASATQETTAVTVTVKDNTGAVKGTATVSAREIGANSGQFEFFVTQGTHDPSAPRSETTAATAAVVRFGATAPTAGTNDVSIGTTSTPGDGWKVDIEYPGTAIKTLSFAPTSASFSLDRTTVGSGNSVTFAITDQDANNDPTAADTIVPGTPTTSAIPLGSANLLTGTFASGLSVSAATLTETGANTGVFEVTFTNTNLGVTSFTSASTASYVMKDYDVYKQPSGGLAAISATSSTITKSLVFQNSDGTLTPIVSPSFATELPITVTDNDRNLTTTSKETITASTTVGVTVSVDATSGDSELVNVKETGDNTGVFSADLNAGRLPVSFINSGTGTANNGILELRMSDISGNVDIKVTYRDAAKADGTADTASTATSTLRVPITHSSGSLKFDAEKASSTGTISVTLTDNDLNNNPDAIDSYTVALSGTTSSSSTLSSAYGFTNFANVAGIAVNIKGVSTDTTAPTTAQTIVFIETGANTGVFKASVDVAKLSSFSDGDKVEFIYKDGMESPVTQSSASFTIGKPSTSITVDRTSVPSPTSTTEKVKFRLTITDPAKNTNSGTQDQIASTAIDQGSSTNDIALKDKSGNTKTVLSSGAADLLYTAFSLTETGADTGVFSGQVEVTRGSTGTAAILDNAKLTITYDSNTVTVTLRPSDLVLTTSSVLVGNGDTLVVTVTDTDRNLDPETKDTVTGITLTTQNDSIASGSLGVITVSAEETGVNTGVFTKSIVIGSDLKVTTVSTTAVTQATEIKISTTDTLATDLTSPTRDLTIKVKTNTGSMVVSPEIVGPGSKFSVMITDNDLNANPSGVETVPTSSSATLDYVTVVTDRTNFPTTRAAGEETGPNTGEFKTTIKLKPKTTASTTAPTVSGAGTKDLTNMEVLPGDIISIKYTDNKNAQGTKVTISKTIKVTSTDPEMKTDKEMYSAGSTITGTITDVDANTDGDVIDSVKVRVTSGSDIVGFDVTALETGANTGVFSYSFVTSTSVSAGSLTVAPTDQVKIKYTDTYPADYADRVKLVSDPSKDFSMLVGVGGVTGGNVDSTTPSKPALKDISGNTLTEVTAGSQVILSADIANNGTGSQQFAAIVEVRDADGITVYLQWQTGTLSPAGTVNVGLSWTPDAPGEYTIRTFVLSSITNPAVLSPVAETTVTVS